jgi:hypothetical protein
MQTKPRNHLASLSRLNWKGNTGKWSKDDLLSLIAFNKRYRVKNPLESGFLGDFIHGIRCADQNFKEACRGYF